MTTAWESLDDPHALGEALMGLSTLSELLERERKAVAVLDPARLRELADLKGPVLERLRGLVRATPPVAAAVSDLTPDQRVLRDQVRAAAVQLVAQAEANAALLNDAIHTLSAALGIEQESGTYDSRARVQRRVRAFARKNA